MENKGYSIIIPAYNEEGVIGHILHDMVQVLNQTEDDHEIIVVNDGSTDGTKEEVLSTGLSIILVNHKDNLGYGSALKTGINTAKYETIVITDSDGTYPNERIPELVFSANHENIDMVVGARIGDNVKIPLIRKPAKWCITKLANYLTGRKIPDLNSGLRIMRKSIVTRFVNILPDGFSFTTTITLAMLTNGLSIKYVPIDYFNRKGKSKIKPIQDTLNFIQLIIRTVLYFNPLKIFIPLSLSLFVISFLVLFSSWYFMEHVLDVTFGVILMSSIIVLAIGMLADLIDKRLS